jgi:hypothetical protein
VPSLPPSQFQLQYISTRCRLPTDEARTCTCSLTHAAHAKASHALPNGCRTGDQGELGNIRINTALRTTGSRITSNPMGQQYALGASCSTASRASREMFRGTVFLSDSSVVPAASDSPNIGAFSLRFGKQKFRKKSWFVTIRFVTVCVMDFIMTTLTR